MPCAQTHGPQKFITKAPMDIIIDHHANGSPKNIPALFGANKDEGSFVLGSEYNLYVRLLLYSDFISAILLGIV